MSRTIRKIRRAPAMPEDPVKRLEEIKKFRELLADQFYDYEIYDVYDSVFMDRVQTIMESVGDFEGQEELVKLGKQIVDTKSTSVKLFIQFFGMILKFMGSE
jgi:hypothetical protein